MLKKGTSRCICQYCSASLPWRRWFISPAGYPAAEATVELVLVQALPGAEQETAAARRVVRQWPDDLRQAVERLSQGPG